MVSFLFGASEPNNIAIVKVRKNVGLENEYVRKCMYVCMCECVFGYSIPFLGACRNSLI